MRYSPPALAFILVTLLIISSCRMTRGDRFPADQPIKNLEKADSAINIIVMGDWGQQGSTDQRLVAARMTQAANQLKANYVFTTGDNLYPAGVNDTSDTQWKLSFEDVYTAPSLQIPWFAVLGNHDYRLNPDAEVGYTKYSSRWRMPSRYYDTTLAIGRDSILFLFIDTEPLEQFLRKRIPDPIRFPEDGAQKQLQWIRNKLSSSNAKWKIVTGHHPLASGGARRHSSRTKKMKRLLQPVFREGKVDIYFSGHEHQLEYLKQKKWPQHYVISGAASEIRHVGFLKFHRKFAARQMGFTTLSVRPNQLLVQFVGADARQLFSFKVVK